MAAINLHNSLIVENNSVTDENIYCPSNYVDTEDNTGHVIQSAWRFNLDSVNKCI